jgi:hypothetical protein
MAALGKPHRCDAQVIRILTWEDAPFADSPGCMSMCSEHGSWLNPFYEDQGLPAKIRADADRLCHRVYNLCASRVPYHDSGEPDHAPNRAAGFASWVASSIGLSLAIGADIPPNALRQWQWYARGHWPCAYEPAVELPEYNLGGVPRIEARVVVL